MTRVSSVALSPLRAGGRYRDGMPIGNPQSMCPVQAAGCGVAVLRYHGSPPHEFTLMVDTDAVARTGINLHQLVEALLSRWLKIQPAGLKWIADEAKHARSGAPGHAESPMVEAAVHSES